MFDSFNIFVPPQVVQAKTTVFTSFTELNWSDKADTGEFIILNRSDNTVFALIGTEVDISSIGYLLISKKDLVTFKSITLRYVQRHQNSVRFHLVSTLTIYHCSIDAFDYTYKWIRTIVIYLQIDLKTKINDTTEYKISIDVTKRNTKEKLKCTL